MSVLPAEISTGMVHGRFIIAMIDGDDADQEPDVIPASGRVVFKAGVPYVPVPVTSEGPVTVLKGPITGVLDSEGYLCTPHPVTGDPMYRGVKLLATDDPDMAVTDWTWTAEYRFDSVGSVTLAIAAHSFALPSGAEIDLTTMVKVPSSPGYGLPQAEAAVLRAEAATQVALDVKAMADAGEFDGEQGLPGNATMRVDTTVGTRIFITDGVTEHMLKGETGRRRIESLVTNGWVGGYLAIGRIGNEVHIFGTGFKGAESTSEIAFYVPEGFRNNYFNAARLPLSGAYTGSTGATAVPMSIIYSTGSFYISNNVAGAIVFSASWPTSDPWPTTLPGIPA